MTSILDALEGSRSDPRVDQDRHSQVVRHQDVGISDRPVVEIAQPVVSSVGVEEDVRVVEGSIKATAAHEQFHGQIACPPARLECRIRGQGWHRVRVGR